MAPPAPEEEETNVVVCQQEIWLERLPEDWPGGDQQEVWLQQEPMGGQEQEPMGEQELWLERREEEEDDYD
jgi:hypothetical protein